MLHVLQMLFFSFSVSCMAMIFALEEGGGGSQLKSSVAFPLLVCSGD